MFSPGFLVACALAAAPFVMAEAPPPAEPSPPSSSTPAQAPLASEDSKQETKHDDSPEVIAQRRRQAAEERMPGLPAGVGDLLRQRRKDAANGIEIPPASEATDHGVEIKVIEIRYSGPASLDEAKIRGSMETHVGDYFKEGAIESDVHHVFQAGVQNTRFFGEAAPGSGLKLIVVVKCRPTIADVRVQGATPGNEEALKKLLACKAGETFYGGTLESDRQKIAAFYEAKGQARVKVSRGEEENETNGTTVVTFTIEGDGET